MHKWVSREKAKTPATDSTTPNTTTTDSTLPDLTMSDSTLTDSSTTGSMTMQLFLIVGHNDIDKCKYNPKYA